MSGDMGNILFFVAFFMLQVGFNFGLMALIQIQQSQLSLLEDIKKTIKNIVSEK